MQVRTEDLARLFDISKGEAWRLLSFAELIKQANIIGDVKSPSGKGRPSKVFEVPVVISIDLSALLSDPERVEYEKKEGERFLQPVNPTGD